ncbi:MAG: Nicotinate-nucleotide pyrophosphorylase [carboxylating] [Candidatus Erwinia impunctatus]|nr:Nicotinate-nucleotide pyrophosphorylase [carboxylating] [Culicoides impunctatus]
MNDNNDVSPGGHTALMNRIEDDIPPSVALALRENLGAVTPPVQDLSASLIPDQAHGHAIIISHEPGIFCGKRWVEEIFIQLGNQTELRWHITDGEPIVVDTPLLDIFGPAAQILTAERALLGFIRTLSGVATEVRNYSKILVGTHAQLADIRQSVPGLLSAFKYAVLCGGGTHHNPGLSDVFLIKKNHILAIGSLKKALEQASWLNPDIPIEVEVEDLTELSQALEAGVGRVRLNNFTLNEMQQAVTLNNQRAQLEASGDIDSTMLRDIAETGIDFISLAAISQNIKILNLTLRFQ